MEEALSLPYVVEPMSEADLEEILRIEAVSFPRPWSLRSYRSELDLPYACYLVVRPIEGAPEAPVGEKDRPRRRWWAGRRGRERPPDKGPVVGYAGFHAILDEGHITTIAVHPEHRGRSIGELLLWQVIERALLRGVRRLTLEVRVSNAAAQSLYEKYGFRVEGRRRKYYANGEDALIMWTDRLDSPDAQARLQELRRQLQRNLSGPAA